ACRKVRVTCALCRGDRGDVWLYGTVHRHVTGPWPLLYPGSSPSHWCTLQMHPGSPKACPKVRVTGALCRGARGDVWLYGAVHGHYFTFKIFRRPDGRHPEAPRHASLIPSHITHLT